jgi:Domain of unknown function (DUF4184)
MPFTFSHPALILPFLKVRTRHICISALVVGSMIPDFEYFIRMKLSGRFSHTIPGIFLFDIPVGLLVLVIFHGVVKQSLINNLPTYINSRLQPLKNFDFFEYVKANFVAVIFCLLIGTVSHIFWDGFTHNDGLFAAYLPILLKPVVINGLPELPVYRWLQHISSAVGAFIIFCVFNGMTKHPVESKIDLRFWSIATFFFTVAFILRASFGLEYYGDTVAVLISSGFVGLIAASFFDFRTKI